MVNQSIFIITSQTEYLNVFKKVELKKDYGKYQYYKFYIMRIKGKKI